MRIVIQDRDMLRVAFFEDALARLSVAAEALKTLQLTGPAMETLRTRDNVMAEYTKFLAGQMAPAAFEVLEGAQR